MNFFQCLLCNQYAEISKRGGDARKGQLNLLLLCTVLITLYIILAFIVYDSFYPGFLIKKFGGLGMQGKAIGRLLAVVIGVVVFILLKQTIGKKIWYDATIEKFNSMSQEEQDSTRRKGVRYFFIAFIPVILFMVKAIFSVFQK
ncbi:MAG: hypothetical protein ABUT20_27675 [Bacteroidota bacterium]